MRGAHGQKLLTWNGYIFLHRAPPRLLDNYYPKLSGRTGQLALAGSDFTPPLEAMAVTVIVPGDALAQAVARQQVLPCGQGLPSQRVDTGIAPDTQPAPDPAKATVAVAGVASA